MCGNLLNVMSAWRRKSIAIRKWATIQEIKIKENSITSQEKKTTPQNQNFMREKHPSESSMIMIFDMSPVSNRYSLSIMCLCILYQLLKKFAIASRCRVTQIQCFNRHSFVRGWIKNHECLNAEISNLLKVTFGLFKITSLHCAMEDAVTQITVVNQKTSYKESWLSQT